MESVWRRFYVMLRCGILESFENGVTRLLERMFFPEYEFFISIKKVSIRRTKDIFQIFEILYIYGAFFRHKDFEIRIRISSDDGREFFSERAFRINARLDHPLGFDRLNRILKYVWIFFCCLEKRFFGQELYFLL